MTKFKIFGAAALVASALASPSMAQEVISNPVKCAHYYPNANCRNDDAGNPYEQRYQRRAYRDQGYRQDGRWHGSYNRYEDGYGPADVAAPIGGEAYARRNGFVCLPGTWTRGEDGRMHICQ